MKQITKEALLKLTEHFKATDKVTSVLVLKSKKTKQDYTYRLKAFNGERDGKRIVLIQVEIQYNKYKTVYIIGNGETRDMKYTSVSWKGANWFLNQLYTEKIDYLLEHYEVYHTGNCIKCNRVLTDSESIEFGMGKICRS